MPSIQASLTRQRANSERLSATNAKSSLQSPIRINQDELQKLFEEDPKRLRDRWQPLKKGL